MQKHIEKLTRAFNELESIAGDDFKNIFHEKQLKKGSFLLKEGNVCQCTWILQSGIARVFSTKKDVEIVTYFAFPGEFIDSYRSYLLQIPSRESIQLLEDSTVFEIKRKDIHALAKKYPIVNEIDKMITEHYAVWLEDRIFSLQFTTAMERYIELEKSYPHFIQRIPLTYLASYLGITLETLSRIRSKRS